MSLGFSAAAVRGCHVCMIFESEEQRRDVAAEYVAAGIRGRERVRYFADRTPPELVRGWIAARGIAVPEAEASGAFAVVSASAAYCAGGSHAPEPTVAAVKTGYQVAAAGGFVASRVCGEMSWVLRGLPGSERFLEYEALLNRIDVKFPHTGMCQYDARLFDGATLFRVLSIHPFVVAQGQIVHNPYYVAPDGPARP
jgi:hypothetical protein